VIAAHNQDKPRWSNGTSGSAPGAGHHALVAQPHTEAEGPIAAAEAVAAQVANRSVHLLGTTTNPDGLGTTQQIRNLVMDLNDHLTQFRFLVCDRPASSPHPSMRSWPMWASAWSGFLLVARGRTVSPNGSSTWSEPNSPTAY
jgi:hypothetical protein